jgi:DNA-binding ferritin-like protein
VRLEQVKIPDYNRIRAILDSFAEKLKTLGRNPYKGY